MYFADYIQVLVGTAHPTCLLRAPHGRHTTRYEGQKLPLLPAPYSLFPAPCSLLPTPYSLLPLN